MDGKTVQEHNEFPDSAAWEPSVPRVGKKAPVSTLAHYFDSPVARLENKLIPTPATYVGNF